MGIDVNKSAFYACIERENEELKEKLQAKEQECKELKREIAFGNNGKLSDKIRAIVFKDLNDENSKYKQALDEIEKIADGNLREDDCDICPDDCMCDWKEIKDIINKANTAPTTIFDKIRSFDSCTLARFIHALISCHENYTCDDCYIATLPFPKRICDTKETLEEIKAWLNEEFKEQ